MHRPFPVQEPCLQPGWTGTQWQAEGRRTRSRRQWLGHIMRADAQAGGSYSNDYGLRSAFSNRPPPHEAVADGAVDFGRPASEPDLVQPRILDLDSQVGF